MEVICAICGKARSLSPSKAKKTSTCGADACKRIFRNLPERRAIRVATMKRNWASPETAKVIVQSARGARLARRSQLYNLGPDWLRERYFKEAQSVEAIARLAGVTSSNVCNWMRRWHMPTRKPTYRWKTKNGYIYVKLSGHHRNNARGYVFEHIVVWEQATGKALPSGWHIHHLNGVRDDNRPENLVALPSKAHALVLAVKADRIRSLEAQVRSLKDAHQTSFNLPTESRQLG